MSHPIAENSVTVERKTISGEVHDNNQGRFVILRETSPSGRYSEIRFPYSGIHAVATLLNGLASLPENE